MYTISNTFLWHNYKFVKQTRGNSCHILLDLNLLCYQLRHMWQMHKADCCNVAPHQVWNIGPIKTRVDNTVPQYCSAFVRIECHLDTTKWIAKVKHSPSCNTNTKFILRPQGVSNYGIIFFYMLTPTCIYYTSITHGKYLQQYDDIKIQVFWNVTLFRWFCCSRRCEGLECLNFHVKHSKKNYIFIFILSRPLCFQIL
jgi:hypothetical protein